MFLVRFGKFTFALLALWFCVATLPAQAQIYIVNNLTAVSAGTDRIDASIWQADAFQTDNHAYVLTSATLNLSSVSSGVVTVDIYSNTGSNKPGNSLITLGTSNPLSTALADITFTPVGTLILQPNKVYWVVARTLTSADWGFTTSTSYTGVGVIPAANAFATSADTGATWTTHALTEGPNKFRVAASTPEPSTIALVAGLGIAGVCTLRRRRKA